MDCNSNDEDKDQSLYELSVRHQASVVSQLVDIASQRNQLQHTKHLPFIERLHCLQPDGLQLRRTSINAFAQKNYLALSYTWIPSKGEALKSGRYNVENWDDSNFIPSSVRDCVFDRVVGYMRHAKVRLLWIDAHCIRQDTCSIAACNRHKSCIQKRDALQAMDLVYRYSKHPIALLGRPLRDQFELLLLAQILSGGLVSQSSLRLSTGTTINAAKEALQVLHDITQDVWWTRAWTFQENYHGGKRIQLLVAHIPALEWQKQELGMFGEMPGELCINSMDFSIEATRLCLALRQDAPQLSSEEAQCIHAVLRAAGRYSLILPESSVMTPTIAADLESRGLKEPWDRLPILANCCQYSVRLDGEALEQQGHHISLATLAMCLLNGEIFNNNGDSLELRASMKTSELLKTYIFEEFRAPLDGVQQLTFNKGCRLRDVELVADGILTRGHLWKLWHVIDTSNFKGLPWIKNLRGRLSPDQRKRLLRLKHYLDDRRYDDIAEDIDEYLAADAEGGKDYVSFRDKYLHRMASEVANAIKVKQKLILGSIWHPNGEHSPYRAVFVWSDKEEFETVPEFVFTSAWPGDPGSDTQDSNDIDRHVSMEVSLEGVIDDDVPLLRTRKWMLGLCFFDGCETTDVVFPWPRAL